MGRFNFREKESMLIKSVFLASVLSIFIQNMAGYAGQIVDALVISKLMGSDYMAAFQLAMPYNMYLTMISQLFVIGVQAVCAKCLGVGKKDEASSAYSTAMICLAGVSIVIGILSFIFANPISVFMGASGANASLLDYVSGYITGLSFYAPAFCVVPIMVTILFIEGRTKAVVGAMAIQTIAKLVLDLANVYIFKQGMLGMGLASAACVYITFIFMVIMRKKGTPAVKFSFSAIRFSVMKDVFKLGLPAALDRVYKAIRMQILNNVLASIAVSAAIAAFGSINTLNFVYHSVTSGLGTALLTMTAIYFGEKDKDSIVKLLRFAIVVTIGIELIMAVISFIFAPFIMGLMTQSGDEQTLEIGTRALRLFALSLPLFGVNYVLQKYYNSIGDRKMMYGLTLLDNLILICLFAILLGNLFAYEGVFISFAVAEACTLIINVIMVMIKIKGFPRKIDDFLDLPKGFEIPEELQYAASATNEEEVFGISEEVRMFCINNNMSKRDAMWFALAVEELGMNIIKWGIVGNKKESMDIRLVKSDSWVLRIRDDCGSFDPTNWLSIHQNDSVEKNMGLRLVLGGAKDVSYVNAMKTNTIIINY